VSLRVLLVEDGLVNQRVAVGLIERMGHHVEIAENGKIAVDAWRQKDFDVILMDWQMPVMDGKEATEIIRNEEQATGEHIPIYAMTAAAMKGDRERCLEAGMDDYISKPIDPKALSKALSRLQPRDQPLVQSAQRGSKHAEQESTRGGKAELVAADADDRACHAFDGRPQEYQLIDIQHARSRLGQCDESKLAEIADVLRIEVQQRLDEIDHALNDRDAVGVTRAAHTLKGAASAFKASELVQVAETIEQMGSENRLDQVPEQLTTLRRQAAVLDSELADFLESLSAN
jgi:CheY-like chemotaxis protein/HPt (histidine-containing phosphotransfer) domain-containing protein